MKKKGFFVLGCMIIVLFGSLVGANTNSLTKFESGKIENTLTKSTWDTLVIEVGNIICEDISDIKIGIDNKLTISKWNSLINKLSYFDNKYSENLEHLKVKYDSQQLTASMWDDLIEIVGKIHYDRDYLMFDYYDSESDIEYLGDIVLEGNKIRGFWSSSIYGGSTVHGIVDINNDCKLSTDTNEPIAKGLLKGSSDYINYFNKYSNGYVLIRDDYGMPPNFDFYISLYANDFSKKQKDIAVYYDKKQYYYGCNKSDVYVNDDKVYIGCRKSSNSFQGYMIYSIKSGKRESIKEIPTSYDRTSHSYIGGVEQIVKGNYLYIIKDRYAEKIEVYNAQNENIKTITVPYEINNLAVYDGHLFVLYRVFKNKYGILKFTDGGDFNKISDEKISKDCIGSRNDAYKDPMGCSLSAGGLKVDKNYYYILDNDSLNHHYFVLKRYKRN